jgi:transposase
VEGQHSGAWQIQQHLAPTVLPGLTQRETAKFWANVLRFQEALWTFVPKKRVEPTNNHAERTIRTLVIWRKISSGCHNEKGLRFVERVLTVAQTLKLQGRPAF